MKTRNIQQCHLSKARDFKAGFHWRRSRRRSRNQKSRAIGSSENQTDGV